ncbi:MAG: glycosyltransferase, partial [Bacteroidota bacterium]
MHSMRVLAVDQDAGRASDRQLYRALAREQHMDLSLLAPEIWRGGLEDVTFEPESPGSLTVDPTPTRFSGKSHRALYSAMLRSVRKIKPDLLFLNAEPESFASAQAALIVSRFSPGTRFVFMSWRNQDYTGSGFPYKLGFLNSLCEKLVLRRAAGCVARTERARELIQGKGFKSVAVIPPAVDTILFHQTEGLSERAELGVHGFCIGYVGRLSQEKGLDLLMRSTVLM